MMGEVSPLGRGDEVPPPELRASHEDRDKVVEMLRIAAGDGRLTAEELDDRLEVAMAARTYGELTALTKDLPAASGFVMDASVPTPKELVRIDCHSGSARRDGRWLVPERIEVRVTSGSVTLDLTEAVVARPSLKIDAEVHSGSLTLVTKPGVVVDTDDVAVRSGAVKVRAPWGPDVPVALRVQVSGQVGSGSIKARPRRRTFWQWLTRQPMPYQRALPRA
ncbi:MAG TPA: DUF1707 domain-containing protein [Streptosporangiaceae bacterium]|jgi:hypothetical protein